ncbi:Hypothetical predicted protein [Octopus vulgaris]|uniref:Uncharacterized protein n=1 Tax=Octopus vulgaris TaxID=6645 RepID=A0AA36BCB7_OCTVU|nr:Hypothetical predicted protein [Octopus vulgaris]
MENDETIRTYLISLYLPYLADRSTDPSAKRVNTASPSSARKHPKALKQIKTTFKRTGRRLRKHFSRLTLRSFSVPTFRRQTSSKQQMETDQGSEKSSTPSKAFSEVVKDICDLKLETLEGDKRVIPVVQDTEKTSKEFLKFQMK